MSYRTLMALAGLLCTLVLAACASSTTPTAMIDFDRSYDFSRVKKIAIQPIDRSNPATVVISDMQVDRINEAVAEELQRRGMEIVEDNAQADMLLAWHLVTQERTDVRSFNTSTRYSCWNCPSGNITVRQYTRGTFIVDMVDPVSLRSVWRSTMHSRMRSQPDPERAEENRRAAAQEVFSGFPP